MKFLDRDPTRPVRHLEWRVRLFGSGAILAAVGVFYAARWMVWIAVGVLFAGMILRYLPERDESGEDA